jgi:aconitate decarboxylase
LETNFLEHNPQAYLTHNANLILPAKQPASHLTTEPTVNMGRTAGDMVESDGATATLCKYYSALDLADIPDHVIERTKYLMLDGIGCGLVGTSAPWSEQLIAAVDAYEPPGVCTVFGQAEQYGPLAAALLNSSFIQATELDDYHSRYPVHGASISLPALFAAVESDMNKEPGNPRTFSGAEFLLAFIVGLESGPRVGAGLYGSDLLTRGWHSGPVFGTPAAAFASSKLLGLSPEYTESAVGIACTQAGGLMACQYEGMIKRVQHGFGSRNGLMGTLIARNGYLGILKVLERPFGGFLTMFSTGNGRSPQYKIKDVVEGLGSTWQIDAIRIKLHACVGGCHGQIEVLEQLQKDHPERFSREELHNIKHISVWLSPPIFNHDGWVPDQRPLETTGAQMNAAYIGAVQLVDGQVLLAQFGAKTLDRDDVWELIHKTECFPSADFDKPDAYCGARVKIEFADGFAMEGRKDKPRGYEPPLSNAEIATKFRRLTADIMDEERVRAIEQAVLGIAELDDVRALLRLLAAPVSGGHLY